MEPNYDNPECLQTFHECTEAKKWELFQNQRKAAGDAVAELVRVCRENAELRQRLGLTTPFRPETIAIVEGMKPWLTDRGDAVEAHERTEKQRTWDSAVLASSELIRRLMGDDSLAYQVHALLVKEGKPARESRKGERAKARKRKGIPCNKGSHG